MHWPGQLLTYLPDEKLLFSMSLRSAFASPERFDDEYGLDILLEAAGNYYLEHSPAIRCAGEEALDAAAGLQIDMIAPIMVYLEKVYSRDIESFAKWADNEPQQMLHRV